MSGPVVELYLPAVPVVRRFYESASRQAIPRLATALPAADVLLHRVRLLHLDRCGRLLPPAPDADHGLVHAGTSRAVKLLLADTCFLDVSDDSPDAQEWVDGRYSAGLHDLVVQPRRRDLAHDAWSNRRGGPDRGDSSYVPDPERPDAHGELASYDQHRHAGGGCALPRLGPKHHRHRPGDCRRLAEHQHLDPDR